VFAEVLLIAFVYVVGILIVWRHYTALDAATWYATPSVGGSKLSLAGMWYGYVSLPIFQFLLCRWYFRLFVWTRFLWQVSRIQLSLVPTHPDRTGGLGFVSGTAYAFALLAGAHGALLAGQFANRIFYLGAALPEFKVEIAVMVIFLLCVVIGPLLVFTPQLAEVNWCFFPDQTEAGLSSLEGRVGRLGSCGSFILHRINHPAASGRGIICLCIYITPQAAGNKPVRDLNGEDIKGGKERNFTAGVNWYLNPNIRLIFNYIRAHVEDRANPPIDNGHASIIQTRLQFSF
jgi:hypothetical protein